LAQQHFISLKELCDKIGVRIALLTGSSKSKERKEILEELKNQQLSPEEITSVWENYSRYRIDHRNTMGWLWMGIGGFMGLVSCVLTMLEPMPAMRGVFMYGLTSVAVAIALYGCYLVMEKPGDEES